MKCTAWKSGLGIVLATLLACGWGADATARPRHDVHHRQYARHRATVRRTESRAGRGQERGYGRNYGSNFDPTPTCYGPDGTPYDPGVIGGPNHVGDGGPAVNFGGYDPCAY